jgi:predicted ArsR family transcriptional regulator
MSRADVAKALGIGVRLAAFHLEKLVADGLLSAHFAREEGRPGGPGSGRPPKWYAAGHQGFDITLPPRRHDLAAMILLRAAAQPGGANRERVLKEARRYGHELAEQASGQDLQEQLAGLGYEPRPAPGRCIDLPNCPFHELADAERDMICSMNLALLQGLTNARTGPQIAVPEQRENYCCVRLIPGDRHSITPASPGTNQKPSV